ncbi:23S rRNA methyltransferase [Paenibacillus yonginensis]|uniref:23S rRNA methyltransferase n=1 Tax=Paenibacillus yonginensis TaxID=1462996 RepID=A0A1B1MWP0_9BACL|nr:23S rRNA (uracil(1939)-C(5))-methyltransferase RlmD [Paenibacillus yonginensis]ANS73600.1 23S rRNA methyltransferase [Paenibacillus yonginensis]
MKPKDASGKGANAKSNRTSSGRDNPPGLRKPKPDSRGTRSSASKLESAGKPGQPNPRNEQRKTQPKVRNAAQAASSLSKFRKDKQTQPARHEHAEEVKVGDRLIITIKRLGINGEGVGYYRRKAVFIEGAIPGEVIKAVVTKVEERFIQAKIGEIEKRSPYRIDAPCPVFGICGGCQIQHMSYEGQLKAKEDLVREAFSRYSGLENIRMKPMLGMDHPWDYRNKAQLQLGMRQEGVIAGLYAAGSHELIDITGCPIQHPEVNRAVDKVRNVLQELQIPVYQERSNKGLVRSIVVRLGFQSKQLQVTLVAAKDRLPNEAELVKHIRLALPEATSIALNANPRNTSLIFGDHTRILWGSDTIEESLGDLDFTLSPRAFFQLNPLQTVKLYESVRAAAALTGRETVVDAYCGTGTIGLWLAPNAAEVRGIETIAEAVQDAKANAERNGRSNATFHTGRAEDLLPRWVKSGFSPDIIIADPPRTGLDEVFLETVLRTKPKRFVYVSCNPSTLAKDCKVLADGGYSVEWVQPVDMFPQTSHVECCVLLVRES